MFRTLLGLSLVLCLSTSALAREPNELTEKEKHLIKEKVGFYLKDPYSAKFRWLTHDANHKNYCGFVNSKNSYGAYSGETLFIVEFDRKAGSVPYAAVGNKYLPLCQYYQHMPDELK